MTTTYETTDMGLASALFCKGFELVEIVKDDNNGYRKANFVFNKKRGESIEQVAEDYFQDKLVVKARYFWDSGRALKNKLHQQ